MDRSGVEPMLRDEAATAIRAARTSASMDAQTQPRRAEKSVDDRGPSSTG